MGLSIRQDTSYLFSSMNSSNSKSTSASGDLSNLFMDYAGIRNGSYGKLMKAYYGGNASSSVNQLASGKVSASKDDSKTIASLQNNASSLKSAADELLATGDKSVFALKDIEKTAEDGTKTTEKGYDTDAIFKAVSKFADSYNATLKSAVNSNNNSVLNTASNMVTSTVSNMKLLEKVGITIGSDNTLSIDEKAFKNADMKTVENLFNSKGSFAYGVQTRASYIEMYAKSDAAKASGVYSQDAVFTSNILGSGSNFFGSI